MGSEERPQIEKFSASSDIFQFEASQNGTLLPTFWQLAICYLTDGLSDVITDLLWPLLALLDELRPALLPVPLHPDHRLVAGHVHTELLVLLPLDSSPSVSSRHWRLCRGRSGGVGGRHWRRLVWGAEGLGKSRADGVWKGKKMMRAECYEYSLLLL